MIAIIPGRIRDAIGPMEMATLIEVVHCADVLWEEKVQCPVECNTNLFVQTR